MAPATFPPTATLLHLTAYSKAKDAKAQKAAEVQPAAPSEGDTSAERAAEKTQERPKKKGLWW